MIPRIVHQIWLGETEPAPPPRLEAAAASWREANPVWEYRRWTGPQIDALFASARPDLLPLYRSYPYWVQRADAARYLVLSVHGGVYADLDIVCVRSIAAVVGLDHDLVLAPTEPLGFSNDLMMAAPHHPLFDALLSELPSSYRGWHRPWIPRHFRVMRGTGSLHLTSVVRRAGGMRRVRLLSAGEYGHGEPDEALVRHIAGNTWAGWDTHLFVFVGSHWKALLAGAAVLAALAMVGLR